MILAQATCGHFALFDEEERLLRQTCRCEEPSLPAQMSVRSTERGSAVVLRHTTSSRRPGRAIVGGVKVAMQDGSVCSDCGKACLSGVKPGFHAPRFLGGALVNCQGLPVGERRSNTTQEGA